MQAEFGLGHFEVDEQLGKDQLPHELKRNLELIWRRVAAIKKLIDTGTIMERPADEYPEGSLPEK